MSFVCILGMIACLVTPAVAQDKSDEGPTNEKARKTYKEAFDELHHRMVLAAFEEFKKADKQDGGHCRGCQRQIVKYGIELQDWKATEAASEEIVSEAKEPREVALARYQFGMVLLQQGIARHKDEVLNRAHDEIDKALDAVPKFPKALYEDGLVLAHLKQDEAAKARFMQFIQMEREDVPERQRAMLYIAQRELARAPMAPPFSVTTLDGKQISLDDLQGKVVLIDFWAT
jgi:tetratricopeptide (TPR) repeat protein